ncbi:hypothetical protein C789_225 [Microcystis aeruginosa FACHB-905 = DIANCHI905]|nr:hypothetical protein C789_225 [Microcystis aeruginosa FACHB-905 = DIANCHI905]
MGKWGDHCVRVAGGRWGDGEVGRWGGGEMGSFFSVNSNQ